MMWICEHICHAVWLCLQDEIGREIIPILHKLEQVSSDEHIGSLAENLLEALRENTIVASKVTVPLLSLPLCIICLMSIWKGMEHQGGYVYFAYVVVKKVSFCFALLVCF